MPEGVISSTSVNIILSWFNVIFIYVCSDVLHCMTIEALHASQYLILLLLIINITIFIDNFF